MVLLALGALACGGNESQAVPTSVPGTTTSVMATAAHTPQAPTELPEPTPAPAATPTVAAPTTQPTVSAPGPTATAAPATSAPPPAPAPQALTVLAEGGVFVPSTLVAAPGALTVTLDNRDPGVSHDLQFYGAAGSPAGSTPVVVGPGLAVVTLDVVAGSYRFVCTVHPLQMRGVLTVD